MRYETVLSSADGIVTKARLDINNCLIGDDCGYGYIIEIDHSVNRESYRTRYGHLTTISVSEGMSVLSGWTIGTSGSTGASSGPHLHFDVQKYINGTWRVIDPFGWQGNRDDDPWFHETGAESWCMWKYGEWTNVCDSSQPNLPMPRPKTDIEFVVNDTTDNSNGFSKGFGGRWNNQCTGTHTSGCRDWWEANGVGDLGHTYYTSADGNTTEDNWAEWQMTYLTPYSQLFEVFVYIPHIPNHPYDTYTWQAKYMVVDGATPSRTFTTIVDEGTTNSSLHNPTNKWLSIGTYFLTANSYVYTTDATGEGQNTHCRNGPNGWCRMTADAVKFVRLGTTYLPDIRKDSSWNSNIILQNLSGANASLKLSFFNGNGNYCIGDWPVIPAHGIFRYTSSICSVPGTLWVGSNQDISVVVENRKTEQSDHWFTYFQPV
jgi:Peptidase family M23